MRSPADRPPAGRADQATIDQAVIDPAIAHTAAIDPVRRAYAGAGGGWLGGATLAYGPMARHLVDRCPIVLRGCTVLDAGAGTGAASDALTAAGAHVIAMDLEPDMLRGHGGSHPLVVGDVTRLSFRDSVFDASVAAFVINHLADPVLGLSALRAVTHSGGCVLASAFSLDRAAVKAVVDDVAVGFGWSKPEWYTVIQDRAAAVGTVDSMAAAARAAGLRDFEVDDSAIDLGLDDPSLVVRYRLGLAHFAGFVSTLAEPKQRELNDRAVDAVVASGEACRPNVIELVARVT